MVEVVAALGAVLLAIVVLRQLLVRFGPAALAGREPGRIRVVDSAALSLKQNVHLVEVDGERILIGAGDSGLVRLARLAPRPAAAEATPGSEGRDRGGPS
ncbi:flagellar biosynthetic protein FliO, partial [Myxococcota bacterium]|nr:flagellar biosynthetic protein FliO [Myxococcota bacterium]